MYQQHNPSRPRVSIPSADVPGYPNNPGPSDQTFPSYVFEVTPPGYLEPLHNPWDNRIKPPSNPRPRVHSMVEMQPNPLSRSVSAFETGTPTMAFPEPQLYRSVSQRQTLQPPGTLSHRHSRSDLGSAALTMHRDQSSTSVVSTASSYYVNDENDHYGSGSAESYTGEAEDLSRDMANISLDSEEALRLFQAGDLPERYQEWYQLVPSEAREALGEQEVQRQSVIFEVFKAEREYVFDLEAVQEVFIEPLRNSSPPIIPKSSLPTFLDEVFGNLHQILSHHQRMLGALLARQREQHPLVQSVADIILDTTLMSDFRSAYEVYIKHYPLAESYHRKELKRNRAYQEFIQSASADPRIRKRDLITFLSRPVTRLPRLNLLLQEILKRTDKGYEHPDLETLPIILGILSDCIKSTQPGIEAAESKVKLWALSESLIFQKGELIDMDLYDESRALIYTGPVSRRTRSDTGWSGWTEYSAALLDNNFILTREEKRSNGTVKRYLMSRPLPLSHLRLGSFNSPVETRRERGEEGGILDSLRYNTLNLYPFTIYHASSRSGRRYTLCVASEAQRKRWYASFVDAIGVHKARQEANMWFDPRTLTESFFRMASAMVTYDSNTQMPGRITTAVAFTSGGRKFIAVGTQTGIYVAVRGEEKYRKVLNYYNPTSLAAIQSLGQHTFNKFLIHYETSLVSYSLDILARLASGQAQAKSLDASLERIAGHDSSSVLFFRYANFGNRALVIYASKKLLQVTPTLHVLQVVDGAEATLSPTRTRASSSYSFRPFGESGYVPKDAYEITPLIKTIGICTRDGIVIADPTNLARSSITIVPDLGDASTDPATATLKTRIEGAKPLGLVRANSTELLVIYDTMGCYITKHGKPTRSSGYIRWESTAVSFAHRGEHILLFSISFIEVRHISTGRLVQAIEGGDIRLLYSGPTTLKDDTIIVAMRGEKNDKEGISDKLVELVETTEISTAITSPTTTTSNPAVWDEWDM